MSLRCNRRKDYKIPAFSAKGNSKGETQRKDTDPRQSQHRSFGIIEREKRADQYDNSENGQYSSHSAPYISRRIIPDALSQPLSCSMFL